MRYKAVLLDMDGTVLDTLEDLASAVNHSLERFGLPQVSVEQVRASLGNGAAWLIGHCVPEGCPEGAGGTGPGFLQALLRRPLPRENPAL